MCGACKAYRENHHTQLVEKIKKDKHVDLVILDSPNFEIKIDSTIHPQLTRYAQGFPSFLLFNSSWYNHRDTLEGVIMNAKIINGQLTRNRENLIPHTFQGIMQWFYQSLALGLFQPKKFEDTDSDENGERRYMDVKYELATVRNRWNH